MIAVAAIWTLIRIAGPVIGGIRSAMAASRARQGGQALAIEEQDMSINWVFGGSLALMLPIGWLLWTVLAGGPLAGASMVLIAGAILFIIVVGLMIASVTGYMAGLIGASNSPVSGIGILAIIASSLLLLGLLGRGGGEEEINAMVAYALIVTGLVFGIATISNDNLAGPQDRPARRRDAVEAAGRADHRRDLRRARRPAGAQPAQRDGRLRRCSGRGPRGAGGAAGGADLVARAGRARRRSQLGDAGLWRACGGRLHHARRAARPRGQAAACRRSPIGIGIYLPMAVILPVVIGAIGGWFYDRWAAKRPNASFAHRMGVLTATGMIVGESLFGVLYAGIVAGSGSDAPLAVTGAGYAPYAPWVGLVLFAGAGVAQLQAHALPGRPNALTCPSPPHAAKGAHLMTGILARCAACSFHPCLVSVRDENHRR